MTQEGDRSGVSVSRYLLILAAVGIFIRVVWIGLPLLEDYNWLRQTQTADGSKSLMERGFWPPYGVASWRGDLEAKLVLELPVYSYLAAGLGMVTGDLDMGGRLVSLGLWVVSYFLAMAIFRRILSEAELRWAALLYVIAPLSIELGIAFQPEMLVQVCGLGFLLTALCYLDRPTGARLVGLFLIGGIGVCVKLPTMSHYYLIFGILLWGREGWRAALRVRYWLFAIGTLLSLKLWGGYVDSVNAAAFPEWTASNILKAFTTQFSALVSVHSWVKVGAYFGAFLVTIVGVPFVVAGFVRVLRSRDWGGMPFLWCLGTLVFYVIWGPRTAMGHAYYNLPALAPLAMLFGMGVPSVMGFFRGRYSSSRIWRGWGPEAALVIVMVTFAGAGAAYLLRQDRLVLEAASWLGEHVSEGELVMVKSNHSDYTVGYGHVPAYSYYSGHRVWIWSPGMGEEERERALETSKWLLVTKRPSVEAWYEKVRNRVKRHSREPEDMLWLTEQDGVTLVHDSDGFSVYELTPPHRGVDAVF